MSRAGGGRLRGARTNGAEGVYTESESEEKGANEMKDGWCRGLGLCALALGTGILIAAIFPVGALLFLVAFLLIGCGCACLRR